MRTLVHYIVPILFLLLAAFFVHKGTDGWGWCIFGAIVVIPNPYRIK